MYWNEAENRVVQEGDTMTNPELADTLQAIADNGVDEFYTGQTAVNLVQDIQAGGNNSSVESQKGVKTVERCSVENQKGTIVLDFVQR